MVRILILGGALAAMAAALPATGHAADAARGAATFETECADCHTVTRGGANRKGPNLFGLVGRGSGQAAGFAYSDANKAAGVTWDAATLTRYIAAPKRMMPGTAMRYSGLSDAAGVADIIAYLATLK
jgi:cytochrome c